MQQRFLLQILLLAQLVSGTTMPIIRSSRVLYSGCCLWYFVLWFSSCWSGVELRVMCPVCRTLVYWPVNQHPVNRTHFGILFPHINDDARSKSHQTPKYLYSWQNSISLSLCNFILLCVPPIHKYFVLLKLMPRPHFSQVSFNLRVIHSKSSLSSF